MPVRSRQLVFVILLLAGVVGCTNKYYYYDEDEYAFVPWETLAYWIMLGWEKSSPKQTALGAGAAIPVAEVGAFDLAPMAGYQRQWFDGGHDDVYTVGLHARQPLNDRGAWAAGELTYNNWRVSDGFADPVANVIGVGGAGGMPIMGRIHARGAARLLFFSDFIADGTTIYEGGRGWQIDLGLEMDIPLKGNEGN